MYAAPDKTGGFVTGGDSNINTSDLIIVENSEDSELSDIGFNY